jgi:hypothetical protein
MELAIKTIGFFFVKYLAFIILIKSAHRDFEGIIQEEFSHLLLREPRQLSYSL